MEALELAIVRHRNCEGKLCERLDKHRFCCCLLQMEAVATGDLTNVGDPKEHDEKEHARTDASFKRVREAAMADFDEMEESEIGRAHV